MLVALLIVNALLGLPFALIGAMKLIGSAEKVKAQFGAEGREAVKMRLIGLIELVGVAGLFLPVLLDTVPVLTPLAALGLLVIMVLAIRVHRRRNEPVTINIAFGALAMISTVLGSLVVMG